MPEYYTFENLECWRQAKDLALNVHRLSVGEAINGDSLMCDQLRGSALKVMSRIAEGKARGSGTEFVTYLKMAKASAAALQSSLILSRDMGYLGEGDFLDFQDRANRVSALIGGLINAIRKGQREREREKERDQGRERMKMEPRGGNDKEEGQEAASQAGGQKKGDQKRPGRRSGKEREKASSQDDATKEIEVPF
jgi:four helix bundle protein